MTNKKRYHVHVCYASKDLATERSILMQKFSDDCFFTWNLIESNASASNYSRHQIDICDYVIFLIGGVYGSLSASGVSYLHLEYIYTTTKQKPMIVLMHEKPTLTDSDLSQDKSNVNYHERKLKDFREHVKRDSNNLHFFNSNVDFINKVMPAFKELTIRFERAGWVQGSQQKTAVQPQEATPQRSLLDTTGELELLGITKVGLNDIVSLSYKVQAFQGGNFRELTLSKDMAWGDVLNIVADDIRMPVPEDVFGRILNDYLDSHALKDVQTVMPAAHAAARSSMLAKDMQRIKLQFAANEWMQTTEAATTGKKQVMLTPQGARHVTQWRGVMVRIRSLGNA